LVVVLVNRDGKCSPYYSQSTLKGRKAVVVVVVLLVVVLLVVEVGAIEEDERLKRMRD
jgi:hypothetical protein